MDLVNRPSHYTQGDIECIDAMVSAYGEDEVRIFCRINAFKYLWRSTAHKDNSEINTKKAMWYMKRSLGEDPRLDCSSVEGKCT